MLKQNIFIIKYKVLYDIFHEIKDILNYNIFEISEEDFDKKINLDYENAVFLTNHLKKISKMKNVDEKKVLVLSDFPISIKDLIEKINIFFLKTNYQLKSEIIIKDYILNLNNKTINKGKIELKLTEKELEIILFLSKNKKSQNILKLQNEIWKYNSGLETHTVETHVYRLRKKIEQEFNDINFIKSNKDGYVL